MRYDGLRPAPQAPGVCVTAYLAGACEPCPPRRPRKGPHCISLYINNRTNRRPSRGMRSANGALTGGHFGRTKPTWPSPFGLRVGAFWQNKANPGPPQPQRADRQPFWQNKANSGLPQPQRADRQPFWQNKANSGPPQLQRADRPPFWQNKANSGRLGRSVPTGSGFGRTKPTGDRLSRGARERGLRRGDRNGGIRFNISPYAAGESQWHSTRTG
jgi:hypothetical protein